MIRIHKLQLENLRIEAKFINLPNNSCRKQTREFSKFRMIKKKNCVNFSKTAMQM